MNETQKEKVEEMYKLEPHGEAYGKCMSVLDEVLSIKPHGYIRGDGGNTNYYNLPEGATTLNDLILHKDMRHGIGEAFCAIYRLNDNGEYLRNLKKVRFYINEAIKYEENK